MSNKYEGVIVILTLVLLIVLLLIAVGFMSWAECNQKAGLLGVEYTYQFISWTSCRVDCLGDGSFIALEHCVRSVP